MKRFYFILLFIPILCKAQIDLPVTQVGVQYLLFNPAYAGIYDHFETSITNRVQWSGIENAPRRMFITLHGPINFKRMGLGLDISHESFGFEVKQWVKASFSYKINFGNGKLHYGMKVGLLSNYINTSKIQLDDLESSDPELAKLSQREYHPDFSVGALYTTQKLKLGLSIDHLAAKNISKNSTYSPVVTHFFTYFSYDFNLKKNWSTTPNIFHKIDQNLNQQINLNVLFNLNEKLWTGPGYRSNEALYWAFGVDLNKWLKYPGKYLFLSYSYDYPINFLGQYVAGSHEINIHYGFRFHESVHSVEKRKSIVSPLHFH